MGVIKGDSRSLDESACGPRRPLGFVGLQEDCRITMKECNVEPTP